MIYELYDCGCGEVGGGFVIIQFWVEELSFLHQPTFHKSLQKLTIFLSLKSSKGI